MATLQFPPLDTLVHGGRVVTASGIQQLDIGIKDGVVCFLGVNEIPMEAGTKIDASGLTVLPGCVDVHVHPRDPGQTYKESFNTLSKAAGIGGVTTIFCQPNLVPPITHTERLLELSEFWSRNSVVDFAIQAMPDPKQPQEIRSLLRAGAISIEFITPSSRGMDFGDLLAIVHENGGISGISCTDWDYAKHVQAHSMEKGFRRIEHWLSAYPARNEAANLARILALTEEAPYEMHFHMLTARQSIDILRWVKRRGRRSITAETAPRYLFMNSAEHARNGPSSSVVPPLRSSDDNLALWNALTEGTIDLISSDHAPHAPTEKGTDGDIWETPAGLPEIELSLPLMLNLVQSKRMDASMIARLMAEGPARRFGIYPKKGTIQVGSDADLVLVDLNKQDTIQNANLVTAPKYSLFDGWRTMGWPVMTLVGGEIIVKDSRVLDVTRQGKWIQPVR